jgi:hypothetical protein
MLGGISLPEVLLPPIISLAVSRWLFRWLFLRKKTRPPFPGNPAISGAIHYGGIKETRGFPSPPGDGFGFFWSPKKSMLSKKCQELSIYDYFSMAGD